MGRTRIYFTDRSQTYINKVLKLFSNHDSVIRIFNHAKGVSTYSFGLSSACVVEKRGKGGTLQHA